MAKTYEELKSGAETVKNNVLPESNTAPLVGGEFLNIIEKLELEVRTLLLSISTIDGAQKKLAVRVESTEKAILDIHKELDIHEGAIERLEGEVQTALDQNTAEKKRAIKEEARLEELIQGLTGQVEDEKKRAQSQEKLLADRMTASEAAAGQLTERVNGIGLYVQQVLRVLEDTIKQLDDEKRRAKSQEDELRALIAALDSSLGELIKQTQDPDIEVTQIAIFGNTSIEVGSTCQLTAVITPSIAADKTVTWTSSAPLTASVSSTGLVTALKVGSCQITARASNGVEKTVAFSVNNTKLTITPVPGEGYTISPSEAIAVTKNGSASFTFTAKSGYKLVAIHVDGNFVKAIDTQSYTYTLENISANHSISAVAIPVVTVRTSVNNSLWGSVTGEFLVPCNSSVNITATPHSGYEVEKWVILSNGDEHDLQTGGNTFVASTSDSDLNFKVYFKATIKKYNVTVSSTPLAGGTINPNGTMSVVAGNNFECEAFPSEGYRIKHFLVDGVIDASTDAYYAISNVQKNRTIQVVFESIAENTMYLGYLEAGDLSNLSEVVSGGFALIKGADILSSAHLIQHRPSAMTVPINPASGSVMLFAVPDTCAYKVTKDDGFGGHVSFSSASGQPVMQANGDKKVTIGGASYRIYGEDVTVVGQRTIYVESK